MTVEQIELRKILSQMLADNGINRETIGDIVKEIVNEKTEKVIKQKVLHETNLEDLIYNTIKKEVRDVVKDEIRTMLRNYYFDFNVNVNMGEKKCEYGRKEMKCRYKELMKCFYLTKDNYKEFLEKFDLINYKVEDFTDNGFFCYERYYFFNKYYVKKYNINTGYYRLFLYNKEEFEEKFEVVD